MADITFDPLGPSTMCVNITINPDTIVEIMEMFNFTISPDQDDGAVQVGSPDTTTITILDQDDSECGVNSRPRNHLIGQL